MKIVSPAEAVKQIKSNNRVFIQSVAAAPQTLIKAMTNRASELSGVEIYHLHTEGEAPYTKPELKSSFHTNALFVGSNVRAAVASGEADLIPTFLSEVPILFRREILPIDVALIHVSPPDRHGYCSLGTSVDVSLAAVQKAELVIAQVNPNMPRTHGDGIIHKDSIHFGVEVTEPLHEVAPGELSECELAIGRNCAGLIEDGATLQMGIGSIPNAVLKALKNHRDLGIHTEMFSD